MFRQYLAATGYIIPSFTSSASLRASTMRVFKNYSTPAGNPPQDDGEQKIYAKLRERFPGTRLEVQDVSGGCGSFYAILISSPAFKGLSTVKQHKLVNECLKEDIKGIHGLQLKTIPEE
ncbi:uncharacterized protein L203_101865 [Cryptococcus depauperatus CBS 7841]|uniref:BolA protein n=1 Tax=Cryptococcus depauperatus CBS 7841 TaxID=1295531 RepID=A0AAJ8JQR1_9TREE